MDKIKLYRAVTVALVSAGIISAAHAEVNDANVNNPSGTTISGNPAVDLDNGGSFTVINDGAISAASSTTRAYGVSVENTTTISNLTNSGTISGTTSSSGGYGFNIISESAITNLTNSGTISGTTDGNTGYGMFIYTTSTITNLINSGTISGTAGGNTGYGIFLSSTAIITNLTNTGTISGTANTNAFDINVIESSHLVNFNNLQSNLSYSGILPRNYSTIIQGSNYGQLAIQGTPSESSTGDTVYTPFAGNADAGAHIKSGTYTNVMTGMPDANLSNTTSGTLSGDGTDSTGSVSWSLTEASTNNWDLTISGGSYAYIGKDNTQLALNQTAKNIGGVFQNMTAGGNFANMTTFDCNLFREDGCVSLGGRITSSAGTDTAGTLVLGKKLNDNFRVGGYLEQTLNHDGYKDIDLDSKVPLVGLMGVWNKSSDHQGLQLKIANSYQSNKAEITRAVVVTSELAKGDTTIATESYIAEASYQIKDAVRDTTYQPFFALRYMKTELDGYTEKDAVVPITYKDMDQENYAALVGVKAQHKVSSKVTLNGSLGLEQDLKDSEAELSGSSTSISAFNSASIGNDKNETRALASLGAYMNLDSGQRVELKGMYQELRYKKDDATTVYITYTLPF